MCKYKILGRQPRCIVYINCIDTTRERKDVMFMAYYNTTNLYELTFIIMEIKKNN